MKKFQVTLSLGRTDTVELQADSLLDVQSIYDRFSEAHVTQIKEVVYFNNVSKVPVTQFYRELKVLVGNTSHHVNRFVTVRFTKPLLSREFVIRKCKEFLTVSGYQVDIVHNIIIHG